jgi:hypothetical protein
LIRFYIFSYEDVLGLEVAVDGFVLLEDLVNLRENKCIGGFWRKSHLF